MALPAGRRSIWIATGVIVAIGVVIFLLGGRGERRREEAVERIALGQPASVATEVIGVQPLVCPGGGLGHLAPSFPAGWSPAAAELAIEQLQTQTAERWLYPLDPDDQVSCALTRGHTEIGVARDGQVIWMVAVLGSTPLILPSSMAPDSQFAADGLQSSVGWPPVPSTLRTVQRLGTGNW